MKLKISLKEEKGTVQLEARRLEKQKQSERFNKLPYFNNV